MKLISRNIFIDTKYFINKSFDFRSPEINALEDIVKKGLAKVYLTEITEIEIIKKIHEEISNSYKKLLSSDIRYLKSMPLFRQFLSTYSEEKATQYITNNFYDFLSRCKVKVIRSDSVKIIDIFNDYYRQVPPFNSDSSKNRKYEFPDAFALNTILNWAKEEQQKTYILSGDSDWKLFSEKTFTHFFGANNELWMNSISTLSEFLDIIIRTESELSNISSFADALIDSNLDSIKSHIVKDLKSNEITTVTDDVDIEAINKYFLGVSLLQKEILSVNRNEAVYNLDVEVDFVIEYAIESFENAVHDPENKFFRSKKQTLYKRFKSQEPFTLEVKYVDGIPGNFKIIHLESAAYLFAYYEDGEDFFPEKWVLNLPVIVCGVSKGHDTENGEGFEHFSNFDEAKKHYPELDIYKPSKRFTQAFGDKISGELRFETWKANEFYSDIWD